MHTLQTPFDVLISKKRDSNIVDGDLRAAEMAVMSNYSSFQISYPIDSQ